MAGKKPRNHAVSGLLTAEVKFGASGVAAGKDSGEKKSEEYVYGRCIFPDDVREVFHIICKCNEKIAMQESRFFSEEQKDEGTLL